MVEPRLPGAEGLRKVRQFVGTGAVLRLAGPKPELLKVLWRDGAPEQIAADWVHEAVKHALDAHDTERLPADG